jgi:hypothetical protein
MTINVTDYFSKFQQESLETLKQTQDANLQSIAKFRELGNEFSVKPGTVPTFENVPNPMQFVEMSFGFASQLLEIRKAYTLKVAQMFIDVQKQAENTFNQAGNTVANGSTMTAPAAKPVTK